MAVLSGRNADGRSAIVKSDSGGYPSSGSSLPVATLSATDRWRSLGGAEGAPRQLEDGCRWVGGAERVEIDSNLVRQCTENTEDGKITDLNFHFKFVTQISGLEKLAPTLRSLDLSTNNIRVMEGLAGVIKLRELKLYSCQISRIQNLEHCVSLLALHLEGNHIGAIEGLDSLRCLEILNMDDNHVQKLGRGLSRLSRLKELYLSRNQLSSLDGLAGLSSLETCSLSHNKLVKVTADQVKGLGKLDELRIAGNQLQSLRFLAEGATKSQPSMPSLVQLDASGNRLTSAFLRDLPPLQQLMELNLAGNQIEEIQPCLVSTCPSLEILDLSGNLLQRGAEDLAVLKKISSLRELLIQGNPFTAESEASDMRQVVLSSMDFLDLLDEQPVERKVEADVLTLEAGGEDAESTFPLTLTKGVSSVRPDSASGSRPTTANSRPGTAQKMSEAGVRDPLMHTKPKLSDKRYASLEQVMQWEKQTLSGLLAVQKQIDKTSFHMDADLKDMAKFLHKADQVLLREKEISGKRPASPGDVDGPQLPTRSAAVARLCGEDPISRPDSRLKTRLQAAVQLGRDDLESDDGDYDLPPGEADDFSPLPSPLPSPSRISPAALAAMAACDEEIEEDYQPVESPPVASSPEPEEVDEHLHGTEADASAPVPGGLGPRAARAMATAAASVAAGTSAAETKELRVDARAKDRAGARPNSRGSQGGRTGGSGRTGGQPSQAPRVVRSSSRGSKH